MTDRQSGHHARFLRAAGLRLDGVEAHFHPLSVSVPLIIERPDRAYFLNSLRGEFVVERPGCEPIALASGDSVGVERGKRLVLRSVRGKEAVVFVSSVPRRYAYIANLPDDVILVPSTDMRTAPLLAAIVEAIRIEVETGAGDIEIVRRLCEVIMLQLLGKVRMDVGRLGQAPKAIQHDAHILRAWSAYFADSNAPWTVEKLADAAGLSRSAFFDRFRGIFGAPPLETLMRLRLDHAKQLLRDSHASVSEIALTVGYRSETALIRAFKREFGVSPGQWRLGEAARALECKV